jgi:hypothetical protein
MRVEAALLATAAILSGQVGKEAVSLGGDFYLERSSRGVIEKTGGKTKFYPLPQSSFATYKRLRAADLKLGLPERTAKTYERKESIGPYQVEDNLVWMGNRYYDSEGFSGVGAFGFFDKTTRKYTLFSPPEIAEYEIRSLLVRKDVVWLGLDEFVEDISTVPGGLLRWDRGNHNMKKFPLEFVVMKIRLDNKDPDTLILTAPDGYAVFRDGVVQRYQIQKSPDGKETAIAIKKFPPPPTMQ